jgi:hypothetical protein
MPTQTTSAKTEFFFERILGHSTFPANLESSSYHAAVWRNAGATISHASKTTTKAFLRRHLL